MNFNILKQLSELNAISSFEGEISKFLADELKDNTTKITYDNLGSFIAIKENKKNNLKIMLAMHMDEVGFIVKKIDEQGYLYLQPVGNIWSHLLTNKLYNVITKDKKIYEGIIGSCASHGLTIEQKQKVLPIEKLYLDLGVYNKQEVEKMGIQVGDMVVAVSECKKMNNLDFIKGKALDNRISLAIGIEVMKKINKNCLNNVYFTGTVQEEVGLRGARTSTYTIAPDIAIAIDTTVAGDTPLDNNICKLGEGVAISMIDSNSLAHRGLLKYIEDLAKRKNIKFQYSVFKGGGTDSGNIHKSLDGIVNLTLSIPIRYMHSSNSIINEKDVDACIELLVSIINEITYNDYLNILKRR